MSGHLKLAYEVPNWTAPNQMALNLTMQRQTKAYTAISCGICAFLGYYAAQSGNLLPTFWDNLSGPSEKVKKFKTEQNKNEVK